jgi:formylglycine-generating enzyme required for sulfatase activity
MAGRTVRWRPRPRGRGADTDETPASSLFALVDARPPKNVCPSALRSWERRRLAGMFIFIFRAQGRSRLAKGRFVSIAFLVDEDGGEFLGVSPHSRSLPLPSHLRERVALHPSQRIPTPSMTTRLYSHPLESGAGPAWASEWGEDRFGVFAAIEVGPVIHRLRWIPAGRFLMGTSKEEKESFSDERPQHEVELTQGFWLGETQVTQALWETVTGENPSHFRGATRPVERVSWDEIQERFFPALSERCGASGWRLPTEAEWERACRADTDGPNYGDAITALNGGRVPELGDLAWYDENSGNETHPVGEKLPNPWGLYDTLGNVWEWCEDRFGNYAAEAVRDPAGPASGSGSARVLRGGSWDDDARDARAACRGRYAPAARDEFIGSDGFRLARGRALQSGAER